MGDPAASWGLSLVPRGSISLQHLHLQREEAVITPPAHPLPMGPLCRLVLWTQPPSRLTVPGLGLLYRYDAGMASICYWGT